MTQPDDGKKAEFAGGLAFSGNIGEGIDKLLAGALRTASERRGGAHALHLFAKKLESVHQHADKAFENGEMGVEERALAKAYVTRCIECAGNYAQHLAGEANGHEAMAEAYRKSIAVVQSHHNVAKARLMQLSAPPEAVTKAKESRTGRRTLAEAKSKETKKGSNARGRATRKG